MNFRNPKVTVLMPVYNGEKYLREAIDSILNQTFIDFEFLIINDASTDSTRDIILSYDDSRIRLINTDQNVGLVRSLNKGLELSKGDYIARMDADDISLQKRLEKQATFLNMHLEIGIVGTVCQGIDANGRYLGQLMVPTSDLQIRWVSLFASPFAHPTVMIRRNILTNNGLSYSETFRWVEDYELWTRLLNYTQGANLRELLMQYRVHDTSISGKYHEVQLKNHTAVALRTIEEQLPEFAINSEQTSQLVKLLLSGVDGGQMAGAELYIDMFETFISRHHNDPNLKALKHQEALKLARRVIPHAFKPGWRGVVMRLLAMDHSLPFSFFVYLLSACGCKLKKHIDNII